jgi:hypothetical protein
MSQSGPALVTVVFDHSERVGRSQSADARVSQTEAAQYEYTSETSPEELRPRA